jgi:hypothetical protein
MRHFHRRFFLAGIIFISVGALCAGQGAPTTPPTAPAAAAATPVQLIESGTIPVIAVNGQRFVPAVIMNSAELGQQIGSQIKIASPAAGAPSGLAAPWLGYGTSGALVLMMLGRLAQSAKGGDSVVRALKTIFMGSIHASAPLTATLGKVVPEPIKTAQPQMALQQPEGNWTFTPAAGTAVREDDKRFQPPSAGG